MCMYTYIHSSAKNVFIRIFSNSFIIFKNCKQPIVNIYWFFLLELFPFFPLGTLHPSAHLSWTNHISPYFLWLQQLAWRVGVWSSMNRSVLAQKRVIFFSGSEMVGLWLRQTFTWSCYKRIISCQVRKLLGYDLEPPILPPTQWVKLVYEGSCLCWNKQRWDTKRQGVLMG